MSHTGVRALQPTGISGAALKLLGGVLLAGAVGGLLFWVIARWTGTPLPTVFGSVTILVLMFVGALAGAFGVYLLTASDLNAIRTYVFAVVCGLAWQPMIASAVRIATNAAASSQTAQVGNSVAQIKAAATNGDVQQINSAVASTTSQITSALNLSNDVADPTKKAELVDTSKQAISALQYSAVKAPDASVDALKNISLTAANSNEPSIALHAIDTLHTIGSNAAKNNDKVTAARVQESLSSLASQSKDVSVQTAARAASHY